MEFSQFERLLRSHGVTVYQVAKATGIGASTFSDWKNGRSTPKADKLARIALIRAAKELNHAIVVTDGDYSVVYTKDGKTEIFKLKKVNGEWKCFSWNN